MKTRLNLKPTYTENHQADMVSLYNSLSEKDRRRYAAVEATKLGHGGIVFISLLFGCDEKTVRKGITELQDSEALSQPGIRKFGGGRKPLIESIDNINEEFLDVLKDHTAGDPMNDKVKWTALSRSEITKKLKKKALMSVEILLESYSKTMVMLNVKLKKPKVQGFIKKGTVNSKRLLA